MRLPVQLRVSLLPSPLAALALCVIVVVVGTAVLVLSVPTIAHLVTGLVLVGWARLQWGRHVTRRSPRAVVEVMLSSDAVIVVRQADGRLVAGHVRASSFAHPWYTTIVWRPDRMRWSRGLPLLPDMLAPDEFRRLRVLLRYGRRELAAGRPASQA